jgi:serine/threonine protein kinase
MMETSLKKKRLYGPDVSMVSLGETMVVEKTYRNRRLPVRIVGFLLIFWEKFIYSKLQGIKGIPVLMTSTNNLTLITKFMGGKNLRETDQAPNEAYFRSLVCLIKQMHSRGVIHLDLRNRRNYGIDDEGNPYLVDFASSLYIPFPPAIRKILSVIDWMGFAKVKQRLAPRLVTKEEERLLNVGNLLSSWWLPTKTLRIVRDFIKKIRT